MQASVLGGSQRHVLYGHPMIRTVSHTPSYSLGIHVLPLKEAVVGAGTKGLLAIWQAAVVFVLLIAGVSVTNLRLARGVERHKDLALRMAIGASWFRVVRQLMTENLLLSLAGAALALGELN
jgi:hypothetical protein